MDVDETTLTCGRNASKQLAELHSRAVAAGYSPTVLDAARVLVVGAGALGQNLLVDLALSGVRDLRIVDADRFEPHNATRSPLFDRRAVARDPDPSKARLCANTLARLATHPRAEIRYADCWIQDLGDAAFEGIDVVVSAVDSVRARLYLARAAMAAGLPFIEGGFAGPTLHLSVFPASDDPEATACWACRGLPRDVDVAYPCGQVARVAALGGIVPALQNGAACLGSLVAEAVIQMLHGHEPAPRRAQLDLRTLDAVNAEPLRSPECAKRHRRVTADRISDLGPDASTDALIAEVLGGHTEGAWLKLPRPFTVCGECRGCGTVLRVQAPQHRFVADAWCTACGGPWPVAAEGSWPASPSLVNEHDRELSELQLNWLGVRPGDRVEVLAPGMENGVVVRLAGEVEWILAPRP